MVPPPKEFFEIYGTVLAITTIREALSGSGQKYWKSCDVCYSPAPNELSHTHLTFECLPRHLLDKEGLLIII